MQEFFLKPREQETNFGFAVWHAQPRKMPECHQHNDIEVNYVISGAFTYLHGGRVVSLYKDQVALFWAGRPHQTIEVSETAFVRGLSVPLGWFLRWKLPTHFTQPLLQGRMLTPPVDAPEVHLAHNFDQWYDDMRNDSADRRRLLLLEVEAFCHRMALRLQQASSNDLATEPTPYAGADSKVDRVEQIAEYITEHFSDPLTTPEIAQAVGLHPNYAVTLFHQVTGSTIIEFLTKQRLSTAQLLLATTDRKVLDIALDAGFGSASRFYAVFKQAFAMSPNEYRAMIRKTRAGN